MTVDYLQLSAGEEDSKHSGPGHKRDKRLERNRESARKCRKKRKAYVGDLEGKFQDLQEENALLQLENQRLQELLQQLQTQTGTPPESASKRAKSEFGVSMANDFSESAEHASQQLQLENYSQLAILTTFLLVSAMVTTTTWNLLPCLLAHSSGQAPTLPVLGARRHAARPGVLPCDQQESSQRGLLASWPVCCHTMG
jgi:regulator of replication initiation timing